ncbi:MAG: hypothetical protein ABDH21_06460 [bacterium]
MLYFPNILKPLTTRVILIIVLVSFLILPPQYKPLFVIILICSTVFYYLYKLTQTKIQPNYKQIQINKVNIYYKIAKLITSINFNRSIHTNIKYFIDKIKLHTNSDQELHNSIQELIEIFNICLYYGRKSILSLIIAYLIYIYQKENLTEKQKEFLRNKLNSIINEKVLNTPRRIIETLEFWQNIHQIHNLQKPSIKKIPAFVKKRLKKILEKYSPLTLKKHKVLNRNIKLKDLIKILHPKPKDNILCLTYSSIIQDTKLSKLKPQEYLPDLISNDQAIANKISHIPIQTLIRNVKKFNIDNPEIFKALENRLNDIISNIQKLNRFVNIFDFYIPIFSLSKKEIINIHNNLKNEQLKSITRELIDNFATDLVLNAIDLSTIIIDYNINYSKIQQIITIINYLTKVESLISTQLSNIDFSLYNSNCNKLKLKQLLNKSIKTYYQNNSRKHEKLLIVLNLPKHKETLMYNISDIAKIISFFTSIYENYTLTLIGTKIQNLTELYLDLTKNSEPIDKYLLTFSFITEYINTTRKKHSHKYNDICEYLKNRPEQHKIVFEFEDKFAYLKLLSPENNSSVIIYDCISYNVDLKSLSSIYLLTAPVNVFTINIIFSIFSGSIFYGEERIPPIENQIQTLSLYV